ncbi:hypothetical protein [Rhizobium leguminosarum]|nr:hypothetical protein [Rhizobium leguminosarum]
MKFGSDKASHEERCSQGHSGYACGGERFRLATPESAAPIL